MSTFVQSNLYKEAMTMVLPKEHITNEEIRQRFDNPFALVNYAIDLAKRQFSRGEEMTSNPASMVLEMILDKEDLFEEEEEENLEEKE